MTEHGCYYQHLCPHCGSCTYEALPMLACPRCRAALTDEAVTFDAAKRAKELAGLDGVTLASELPKIKAERTGLR